MSEHAPLEEEPRFLSACRGRPVDRPPVWLMRQAGRYLPEYQAVRERAGDFLTLCHTPDLATEVTLQPIRRFGFDAAILFSDILVPAEAMGAQVVFAAGEGPRIENPVRTAADVARLVVPEPEEACGFVLEAVRQLRRALPAGVPLIGFAAAPWTLLAYLVEGHGSRDFALAKAMMMADPALGGALLDKIADYTSRHAVAQVRAGCQAFQLFDTWAELLSPDDWAAWSLPWANRVIDRVRAQVGVDVPIIYFCKGTAAQLDRLGEVKADVLSLDWRVDLARARRRLGKRPVQGNIDPIALLGGPAVTRARAQECLERGGGEGHVVNLGHGILPQTPIASVEALVETVRSWTSSPARTA